MTYQEIKSFINTYIVQNGVGTITGSQLNTVLNELADYKGFDSVVVTTLPAGSDATATVQGMTLVLGIPKGADGRDGQDGQNAVNPFKGWFNSLAELKSSYIASVGDSAYVKDASPATTWSIYIYDSTASSDNYWADSGHDADTSNVQTFASGEEVNETYIDNTHLVNPVSGALPKAEDAMLLKQQLRGVTLEETKILLVQNTNWYDGKYLDKNGVIQNSTGTITNGILVINATGYKRIRFLGYYSQVSSYAGYGFSETQPDATNTADVQIEDIYEFDYGAPTNQAKEYIVDVPEDKPYFVCTIRKYGNQVMTIDSFYCYMETGQCIDFDDKEEITLMSGQIETRPRTIGEVTNLTFVSQTQTQYALINVNPCDVFHLVNCLGGNEVRQYAFVDRNNVLLQIANSNAADKNVFITAPQDAAKLIINSLNYPFTAKLYKLKVYDSFKEYLERVGLEKYNTTEVKVNGIFTDSRFNRFSGAIEVNSGSCRTYYLPIGHAEKIMYSCNVVNMSNGVVADSAIAFFDENYNFICSEGYLRDDSIAENSVVLRVVDIPCGAKFFAVGMLADFVNQMVVRVLTRNNISVAENTRKHDELPNYTPWRSRYSLMKDFGQQPSADGNAGSFCNVVTGGYTDLLSAVYEPLRTLYPDYITRTNIGKDATGTIDMYVYDLQPKYYQQHIYLQAGIHAIEPDAIASLARITQMIANAYEGSDADLIFMRENIRFTIVPVVNVWGFSQTPKNIQNGLGQGMQNWGDIDTPQEMQNIKNYIFNNDLLKEFSFMMDMHTTTNNTYSNFYGAIQRHSKCARTVYRTNAWLYKKFIPNRGIVHNAGKDLGYNEIWKNLFRTYFYSKGAETFTAELTDYIWDGNNASTSPVISVGVSMWLNYIIQMMNDFYISMYDIPNEDYHQTAG